MLPVLIILDLALCRHHQYHITLCMYHFIIVLAALTNPLLEGTDTWPSRKHLLCSAVKSPC